MSNMIIEVNFIHGHNWMDKVKALQDVSGEHDIVAAETLFEDPPIRDVHWVVEEAEVQNLKAKIVELAKDWDGFDLLVYPQEK